jgi:predicted phage terminase large subunit-like protein
METSIDPAMRNRLFANPAAGLSALQWAHDTALAERSLLEFTKQAWDTVIPEPLQLNWHIESICDHLEAVANKEILRLLINIPPRHMKSTGTNIFFPAWIWAQNPNPDNIEGYTSAVMPDTWRGPGVRFAYISHAEKLAVRDSMQCRRVLDSPYYQERWGDQVQFRKDENLKMVFANTRGGRRMCGVMSSMTGEGGDIIVYDDPLDAMDADSEIARAEVIRFWTEQIPNRLNANGGVLIVVMQRLHSQDLSGFILAKELNLHHLDVSNLDERKRWVHLCFPARFEIQHPTPVKTGVFRKIVNDDGSLTYTVWKDPRTKDGEALWENRFPIHELDERERELSPFAVAGQMQQRPIGREGGKFKRAWFTPDKFLEANEIPAGTRWVRHWDLAGTAKDRADWTVGLKLGLMPNDTYVVGSVIRFQKEGHEVRDNIKATAGLDGYQCDISLPQDPGQAGKIQAADMVRMLAGYVVVTERETGPKVRRADPVAVQASHGNLYLVRAPWNEAFLDELCLFPSAPHDDQVDALSGAFARFVSEEGEFSVGGVTT